MDIGTYNRREKMLKLREELLAVEEDRMRGRSAEQLTAEFEKTTNSFGNHAAEMSVAHRGIYSQKRLSVYPV